MIKLSVTRIALLLLIILTVGCGSGLDVRLHDAFISTPLLDKDPSNHIRSSYNTYYSKQGNVSISMLKINSESAANTENESSPALPMRVYVIKLPEDLNTIEEKRACKYIIECLWDSLYSDKFNTNAGNNIKYQNYTLDNFDPECKNCVCKDCVGAEGKAKIVSDGRQTAAYSAEDYSVVDAYAFKPDTIVAGECVTQGNETKKDWITNFRVTPLN